MRSARLAFPVARRDSDSRAARLALRNRRSSPDLLVSRAGQASVHRRGAACHLFAPRILLLGARRGLGQREEALPAPVLVWAAPVPVITGAPWGRRVFSQGGSTPPQLPRCALRPVGARP